MNKRKIELIELSIAVKSLLDNDSEKLKGFKGSGVNDMIKFVFYPAGEYNTFKGWKDKGLIVKKGSKGFAVWGRKRKFKKKGDDDGVYSAFPLAYIFNENQVEAAK